MYLAAGASASYDIQFKGDPSGHVNASDLLSVLSPAANMAATVLQNVASQFSLQGVDIGKLITSQLMLKDAGIIMRQYRNQFATISVDDLYGTISISDELKLAQDVFPFPAGLKIPPNLPDVSLIIPCVTGEVQSRVSLERHLKKLCHVLSLLQCSVAFSQDVAGLGLVAVEIGPSATSETKIDIWTFVSFQRSLIQYLCIPCSSAWLAAELCLQGSSQQCDLAIC